MIKSTVSEWQDLNLRVHKAPDPKSGGIDQTIPHSDTVDLF